MCVFYHARSPCHADHFSYPHIGYDINGKKIMRPATGDALQSLLDSIEVPKGWTGLTDVNTGNPLNLTYAPTFLLPLLNLSDLIAVKMSWSSFAAFRWVFSRMKSRTRTPIPSSISPPLRRRCVSSNVNRFLGLFVDSEQPSAAPPSPSDASSLPRTRPSRS